MVKKLISLILTLTVLMALVVGCGQKAVPDQQKTTEKVPGVTDTTIILGALGDMSGPTVATQVGYHQGMRDYIKLTNDNGGVNGRKIEIRTQDDQYKVDKTLAGFRSLIENGTFAIISQAGSANFAGIDPEIKEQKIPVFGPMQVTQMESNNPYTYTMNSSMEAQGKIFIKRVLDIYKGPGKPKIAFFCLESAAGDELGKSVRTAAKTADISIVQEERIPNTVTELTAQIIKLKQSGANYVLFFGTSNIYIAYLRDAVRLGVSDIPVIANFTGVNSVIYETAGKEATKNYTAMHSFNPYFSEGPGLDEMRKFAEINKTDPKMLSDLMYVQSWTSAKVFVEALRRAGKNLTRESLIKAIESINNFDTGGLSGPINFGPNKRDAISSARFFQYDFDQKKLLPVSSYYTAN